MYRYYLEFSKTGNIRFISHLDLLRLFKRTFKRSGIELVYSQGFNPHPKLGFAQPLSLGYEGLAEILEFETVREYPANEMKEILNPLMPEGIQIQKCEALPGEGKSLAALADGALYQISIPMELIGKDFSAADFLAKTELNVEKKNKKKEMVTLNIRPMIRDLKEEAEENFLLIHCDLDAGSTSNLSPELLLQAIRNHTGRLIPGEEINIIREKIYYVNNYHI